jgi:low temperature requirement protein LtrA
MEKVDAKSLILGVLVSIVALGLYETIFYLLQSKTLEQNSSAAATLATFLIALVYFWAFFLRTAKRGETKATHKALAEKPEETEQEKLKREFQHRVIA